MCTFGAGDYQMTDNVAGASARQGSAVLNALPAIALLMLYLWIAVGLIPFGFLILGVSGQYIALAIFIVLAIPGVWLSMQIIRLSIAAERDMLELDF